MSKHITNILAFAAVLLLAAGSAAAKGAEDEKASVDWEEAYDYAGLVEIETFGDDVVWETYLDKEQQVMWSQPAGTAKEELVDYMSSDGLGYGPEICIVVWLYPYWLRIDPDGAGGQSYENPTYEYTCYDPDADTCKQWYFTGYDCYEDLDGYVHSKARCQVDYTSSYDSEYWDMDGPGGNKWNGDVQEDTPYYYQSYWRYPMYENEDIEGESGWDYCTGYTTRIAQHWFVACGYDLVLRVGYQYDVE